MKLPRAAWLLLPLIAVGLDLWSKACILQTIPLGESRTVIPGFFYLTLHYNPGAIFGTLGGLSPALRTVIFTVAGIGALAYFGWEFLRPGVAAANRVALGMILGGAVGNGLDRIRHGMVVDFLDFVFWGWHYWTFNVADSFIVCGAILLGILLLVQGKRAPAES